MEVVKIKTITLFASGVLCVASLTTQSAYGKASEKPLSYSKLSIENILQFRQEIEQRIHQEANKMRDSLPEIDPEREPLFQSIRDRNAQQFYTALKTLIHQDDLEKILAILNHKNKEGKNLFDLLEEAEFLKEEMTELDAKEFLVFFIERFGLKERPIGEQIKFRRKVMGTGIGGMLATAVLLGFVYNLSGIDFVANNLPAIVSSLTFAGGVSAITAFLGSFYYVGPRDYKRSEVAYMQEIRSEIQDIRCQIAFKQWISL